MTSISRRDFLAGPAAAFAAFGFASPVLVAGTAEAQPLSPERRFLRYRVGDIEVTSLYDGAAQAPLREGFVRNASVEQAAEVLRAAGQPTATVNVPFIVTALRMPDGRVVLVDSGTGGSPAFGPGAGFLRRSMEAAGIEPGAVRTVLVSHLHADHILGLMDVESGAQRFPDAEIIVPAADLRWWTGAEADGPAAGANRRGLAQRIRATIATWPNVRPVEGEAELLPGVRALPAPGHSPGMVVHQVSSGNARLLITADTSFMPVLFARHPEWQPSLDQMPEMAAETRRRVFERAVADGAMVTGTHWPLPNVGTLSRDGSGYIFAPAPA